MSTMKANGLSLRGIEHYSDATVLNVIENIRDNLRERQAELDNWVGYAVMRGAMHPEIAEMIGDAVLEGVVEHE